MKAAESTRLWKAAQDGDLKTVNQLLVSVDPSKDRAALNRALCPAVFLRHARVVERLLSAGASPEQQTSIGTLLMAAARNGDLPIVKRLVEAGANIHRAFKRETALSAALSQHRTAVVKYLETLKAHSPPNASLLYASMYGDVKRMKRALANGADVEKRGGPLEETPLMAAARIGHVAAVKLLLKHGAEPNARFEGRTALFNAVESGGNPEVFEAFLEAGADIRVKHGQRTLLMAAANGGYLPIVKRLIELGANVHTRDKNFGKTALDYAKDGQHKAVIAYLRSLGVAADRDAPRTFVRALAREFGGRPAEHLHGFLLNTKFAGEKCQFHVRADRCAVDVFGLNFTDPEIKRADSAEILLAANRPKSPYGQVQPVTSARRTLGVGVYRSLGECPIPSESVTRFCARHRHRLKQVALSGKELIGIGVGGMRFEWVGTDIDAVRPRLQKLASLIRAISKPPQPERRLFDREWLLKVTAKRGGAGHWLGGTFEPPVECPHCGDRTNLMARVNLSDLTLPKTALGRQPLPVFWCLACAEWDPTFFDLSGAAPRPLDATGKGAIASASEGVDDELPERPLALVSLPPGKRVGRKSKLGGAPTWLQDEDTPQCSKCELPMAFVLQLVSDSRISYGDGGVLYAFACPKCKVTASLVQSY